MCDLTGPGIELPTSRGETDAFDHYAILGFISCHCAVITLRFKRTAIHCTCGSRPLFLEFAEHLILLQCFNYLYNIQGDP